MSNIALTKQVGNYTVNVMFDNDAESPRSWDNLGTILYSRRSRYTLGDKAVESEEIDSIIQDDNYIHLPVYAYIHSYVCLSTKPFSCQWDSGQSGIIYISKETIKKEFKAKRLTKKLIENAKSILEAEIEIYSQYLEGQVYGYEVLDENDNFIDSCWGYIDTPENVAQEAINTILRPMEMVK